MQEPNDPSQQLPIDITYSKLADWLVDRRKLPPDWRKKLGPIRNRIAAALVALPKDVDPWFAALTQEATGYLEAKHIRDKLTEANPEARTLFGRLSGAAGIWDAIVRAYERDFLYLGDAAQTMIQEVNYEIPYQKKQIAKLQQQLVDLERKEVDYKRNAAATAVKYQQSCQELGIQGKNVRMELVATAKTLPSIFTEIVEVLCSSSVGQALDCYKDFVSYAHTEEGAKPDTVALTLKELRDNPPTSHTLESPMDCICTGNDIPSVSDLTASSMHVAPDRSSVETISIDWNIDGEENGAPSIDWDIGSVENPAEEGIGTEQIASMNSTVNEMQVNQSGALHIEPGLLDKELQSLDSSREGINWGTGDIEQLVTGKSEFQCNIEGNEHSEINWDISVDEDGLEAVSGSSSEMLKLTTDRTASVEHVEHRQEVSSCFMESEYRNKMLDDLFEIKTFLVQRDEEINRDETSSLQNQVQAVASPILQQYGTDSSKAMVSDISRAISLLTNKKTRELIMILTSKRFLDRLENSLNQKKLQEVKLLESLKDIDQKRLELRNMLTVLWHKQEAALIRIQKVKELCEKIISTFYGGRQINIIGEINSVLGQA